MIIETETNLILKNIFDFGEKFPEEKAIYFKDKHVTYKDLIVKINSFAEYLDKYKANGQPIAIHASKDPDFCSMILAIWKTGNSVVILNHLLPFKSKLKIMNNANPIYLCGQTDFIRQIKDNIHFKEKQNKKKSNLAYISYTNYSTKDMPGVEISFENLYKLIEWTKKIYSDEELECVAAINHTNLDLLFFEMIIPLSLGKSVMMFDNIFELIEEHNNNTNSKISLLNLLPTDMGLLVKANAIPKNVKTVNLSGGPCNWGLVKSIYNQSKVSKVYNLWHLPENTIYATSYLCEKPTALAKADEDPVPLGQSLEENELLILNENNQNLGKNKLGEISLSGGRVALSYRDNEKLTNSKFILHNNQRIFKTGILGILDENGNLTIKQNLTLKFKGYELNLKMIEEEIKKIEKVSEAKLIIRNIDNIFTLISFVQYRVGKSQKRLKKEKSLKPLSHNLCEDKFTQNRKKYMDIISKRLMNIIPIPMMPDSWVILKNSLPRNENREICPIRLNEMLDKDFDKTVVELKNIKNFYHLLLYVLGIQDAPYNLARMYVDFKKCFIFNGGNILKGQRLCNEAKKRWEVNFTLKDILNQKNSLETLRNFVSDPIGKKNNSSLTQHYEVTPHKISIFENQYWELYKNSKLPEAYNLVLDIELDYEGDKNLVLDAYKEVFNNTEILKTNFIYENTKLSKQINPDIYFIPHMLNKEEKNNFDEKYFYNTPFDLSSDFLARVAIIETSKHKFAIKLCFPRIVIDESGVDELLLQVFKCLKSKISKSKFQPTKRNNLLFYEEVDEEKSYNFWKQELYNYKNEINLNAGINNDDVAIINTHKSYEFTINRIELDNIIEKLNITIESLLLNILSITLNKITNCRDYVISIISNARSNNESEFYIGNLTNIIPFRVRIDSNENIQDMIINSNNKYLDLISNQISKHCPSKFFENLSLLNITYKYNDFIKFSQIPNIKNYKIPRLLHSMDSLVFTIFPFLDDDKASFLFKIESNILPESYLEMASNIFENITISLYENLECKIHQLEIGNLTTTSLN